MPRGKKDKTDKGKNREGGGKRREKKGKGRHREYGEKEFRRMLKEASDLRRWVP